MRSVASIATATATACPATDDREPLLAESTTRPAPFGGACGASPLLTALGLRQVTSTCTAEPPGYEQRHRLDARWAIVATLGGNAQVRHGGARLAVGPGDVFVVPPGIAFREQQTGTVPWSSVATLIDVAPPGAFDAWWPLARDRVQVVRPDAEALQRHVRLAQLLDGKPPHLDLELMAQLSRLLLDLTAACAAEGPAPAAFVEAALGYMRHHVARLVSVSELATHCGMSDSTFAHRFKAATGVSPMRAFDRERIRRARELLVAGHSVSETAAELGFATPYHFSRVFKRIEGVPPRHLRQLSDRRW